MKVETKITQEITLFLTAKEAWLLKAYVQNSCCAPEQEPEESRTLRENLFNLLPAWEDLAK